MSQRLGPAPVVAVAKARLRHARPVIAWVALGDRDVTKSALLAAAEACGCRAQSLRVLARHRPGSESIAGGVAASPDALELAVREAIAALPPHDLLFCEGTAAIALLEADVALLVSDDRPPTGWPADLREVRSVLDLVLVEPRPGVLSSLVGGLAKATQSSPVRG